jgi:hypothetical protein
VRVALALEGHGHLAVLPRQPRLLDARDPGGPGHFGAHDAPLVGRAAQDLPGRGRIGVRAGEDNVTTGEETGLERGGIAHGACGGAGCLPLVIEHGSMRLTVGGLVDQRLGGADLTQRGQQVVDGEGLEHDTNSLPVQLLGHLRVVDGAHRCRAED